MRAYERLLNYVKINTQSDENAQSVPSTPNQLAFCGMLREEMERIGMERVYADENAYVYGFIPASEGYENEPVIGFIAHLDTSPDFSGENVSVNIIEAYDGRDVVLGSSGRVTETAKFPDLCELKGHSLIVTDGNTLLGADDKAGIAEIMTACERIINEGLSHCAIAVCFTPDEEIGHGAEMLDLKRFSADFAYTVDGDAVNEINYETFNAAAAVAEVNGVSVHPGSAKGVMINASLVAMEFNAMLPANDIPAETENYEGFYHLLEMSGDVEKAQLRYIVRDHDAQKFAERCDYMRSVERSLNEKYGAGTVKLSIREQYRNMAEILCEKMQIVERAERAIRKVGLEPVRVPIRGGTDGSQLSFRGLPCPNLGTGGAAFHGPHEHISIEMMDTAVDIILNIVSEK